MTENTPAASQLFLQSASVDGKEIPRSMITTASYIEVMSLKAPVLRLEIRDVSSHLTNEFGLKVGSVVAVKMGGGVDQSSELWSEEMIVISPELRADVLTVKLVPVTLFTICQPAQKARFFVSQQPLDIVKALVPANLQTEADPLPGTVTYHLNMREKPASVLRLIAADSGARVWIARGKLRVRLLKSIEAGKPVLTYEMNNPDAVLTLTKTSQLTQDDAYLAKARFRFTAYSETEGFISIGDPSWPVKTVSNASRAALMNMSYAIVPKLDAECEGNPALCAGMVVSIVVHRYDAESGRDESVPAKMVIMSVTHHEERRAYFCRMILGEVKRVTA